MRKVHLADDSEILEKLRINPENGLTELYARHKSMFLGYIKRFGGRDEDHLEVYHDAVLAFYDIWTDKRYDQSRAAISTLLCAIGKNKLLTKLGKQQKSAEWTELTPMIDLADEEYVAPDEGLLARVETAMELLGDGCKEIIALFYYNRCSVRDIVDKLNYKNENVVKAHKSRCMKRLKDLIETTNS